MSQGLFQGPPSQGLFQGPSQSLFSSKVQDIMDDANKPHIPKHVIDIIVQEEQRYQKELERVKQDHAQRLIIIADMGLTLSPEDLKEAIKPCKKND